MAVMKQLEWLWLLLLSLGRSLFIKNYMNAAEVKKKHAK